MKRKNRFVYENVPRPRRSEFRYRRKREAEIEAQHRMVETDSDSAGPCHPVTEPFVENDKIPADYSANEIRTSSDEPEQQVFQRYSKSSGGGENISNFFQMPIQRAVQYLEDGGESSHHFEDSCSSATSGNKERSEFSQASNKSQDEAVHTDGIGACQSSFQLPHAEEQDVQHTQQNPLLDQVLCPCTSTTEGDALLMCLALGMRHNMSWVAIVDILKMINLLFGRDVVRSSKYYLMEFFDCGEETSTIHIFCSKCEMSLGTRKTVTEQQIVQCHNCGERVNDFSTSSSYFVSVDLKKQFKNFMELPGVAQEIMSYRFQRIRHSEEALSDIFDGEGYKALSDNGGPLSEPKNLSVAINTDGMALGVSTSQSAWPIFLTVNELSPKNRKKHVIFAGIWVGKTQPNMRIFLKPFVTEMKELTIDGFKWTDNKGDEITSKVFPLLAILDSGARYKFINLSSFASYDGCSFCYQRAENTCKGRRFTVVKERAPLRTHESMCSDMVIAHEHRHDTDKKKRIYRGCKGLTPLILLAPYLDLGKSVVVDFMHNALLGVTRSFVYQMLRVTTDKGFYVGEPEKMHRMNERLQLIRPPKTITRTPRSLSDVNYWRANEWRSFLFFYGIVCMDGVLQHKYLEHFCMLSSAFYNLLQDSISEETLRLVSRYLVQYVFLTEKYHGKTAMTYNIHLLLHVSDGVRHWGPLWTQNMFVFEGENRNLGQMHTSPGRIPLQLTRRYLMYSAFPTFCERYASNNAPLQFVEDIMGRHLKNYRRCGDVVLIGIGQPCLLKEEDLNCMAEAGVYPSNFNGEMYNKVLCKGIRYTTSAYSEGKKNDDSWIRVSSSTWGNILKILRIQTGDNDYSVVVIMRELIIDRNPVLKTGLVTVNHIKRIENMGGLKATMPSCITAQCINMHLDTGHFLADMPFGCYGD